MNYDLIIVGSGIVGSTAALLLAKNTPLQIALIESKSFSPIWSQNKYDHRVSAISLNSKKIFESIDVWHALEKKRMSPFTHMEVWDAESAGKIFFDREEIREEALGYIIEDSLLRESLHDAFSNYPNLHFHHSIMGKLITEKNNVIEFISHDGKTFSAHCLIAADGAESWVRTQKQIPFNLKNYQQKAIVATVNTEMAHDATARQRFLSTGPLAFLPLKEPHLSSIVWSADTDFADHLLQLDDEQFKSALAEAFAHRLGKILQIEKRFCFSLYHRHVKNYIASRLVLMGDAAHTIHPLAGLGVNLGLADAQTLSALITDACQKQKDFFSHALLRRYERSRKNAACQLFAVVDGLKNLFASDQSAVKFLRGTGLNLTNKISWVKKKLIREINLL